MGLLEEKVAPRLKDKERKVLILGLPNSGKTQIYNNLTGTYNLVANYHHTTIDVNRAYYEHGGLLYELYDVPGLYCLYANSEEELLVRNLIFSEEPDVLLFCLDANLLKQSLMLGIELMELGIPMVIALNAIDETSKKGIWIDTAVLSSTLGVPVVESIAIRGIGTRKLKHAIERAKAPKAAIYYGDIVEAGVAKVIQDLPEDFPFKRKTAMLLLLNDKFLENDLISASGEDQYAEIKKNISDITSQFVGSIGKIVYFKRSEWVDQLSDKIVKTQQFDQRSMAKTFAQMSRSVVTGIPIFCMIILITYFLVVNVANEISTLMETYLWTPVMTRLSTLIVSPFWRDFLLGSHGLLSLGLGGAILTVLPILSVFFVVFNVLEDMGYVPNLTVLTRRLFTKVGLSGYSIMPIVLGFGCKTMATFTTRTINSDKEKYIAIFLIAFALPCAPQIGLSMGMLGKVGFKAFLIVSSVLLITEITAGVLLNIIMRDDTKNTYLQALPAIRIPNVFAVLKKTYYRLYMFLKEALPIFLLSAVFLFTLERLGFLKIAKVFLAPLINNFLGLPNEMVDVLILVLARREAAAAVIMDMVNKGGLNFNQAVVSVTLTTMFVPCFANLGAMIKEMGLRRALTMAFLITASSLVISGALNKILLFFNHA
ncbi:ferrous iron transporter B [Candidatus Magnetomonas plexicatena]|uniref:ferrous iron transporter B n=1 Tax=Candidatus Magnetomonas plexicatena TaxID=2552947 RepID=UPI001100884D|nr:ferrous iron transporter B [Nitrospirales bacterium LBB_01]